MRNQILGHNVFARHTDGVQTAGMSEYHLKKTLDMDRLDEIVESFEPDSQWVIDYLVMMKRRRKSLEQIKRKF